MLDSPQACLRSVKREKYRLLAFDREATRGFAALPYLPHHHVGRLDRAAKAFDIEERTLRSIACKAMLKVSKQRRIARESQRQGLVVVKVPRDP